MPENPGNGRVRGPTVPCGGARGRGAGRITLARFSFSDGRKCQRSRMRARLESDVTPLSRSPARSLVGESREAPLAPAPDSRSDARLPRRTLTFRVPKFSARPTRGVTLNGTVTAPPRAAGGPVTTPSILKVRACADAGRAASRATPTRIEPV